VSQATMSLPRMMEVTRSRLREWIACRVWRSLMVWFSVFLSGAPGNLQVGLLAGLDFDLLCFEGRNGGVQDQGHSSVTMSVFHWQWHDFCVSFDQVLNSRADVAC